MKPHSIVTLIKLGLWEHAEFFSTDLRDEYEEFHICLDPVVKNQGLLHVKSHKGRAIYSYNFATKEVGLVA